MAKIIIIGGHGKVALELTPLLIERGDEVFNVIRKEEQKQDITDLGATPVVADIGSLDASETVELLRGYDAVVWSAGAGGRGGAETTYAVDRDAAIRSMDAAKEAGVDRYVMLSYLRAREGHGVATDDPFYPYIESKKAADEHLRQSGLDYTIVAPDVLSADEPTGKIDQIPVPAELTTAPRKDVAAVIAEVLKGSDGLVAPTLGFSGGDTPIAQAIRA